MMKKLSLAFLGVVGLLLNSCSQEDINNQELTGDTTVTFTINLPKDFSTRQTGDGTAATDLYALVYEAENNSYVFTFEGKGYFNTNVGQAQVNLDLVAGKNYNIVFFVGSSGVVSVSDNSGVYYLDGANHNLSVNYASMTSQGINPEAYDCFYGKAAVTATGSGSSQSVTLSRPVAQINWGTNDLSVTSIFGENGGNIKGISLNVIPYVSMDLLTGEVTLGSVPVIIPSSSMVDSEESFPVDGYQYLALQYLLAPSTSATLDLTLTISGGNSDETVKISDAPVQANYQTNIYGALLSGSSTEPTSLSSAEKI